MLTKSAKAKARRLQNLVSEKLFEKGFHNKPAIMGEGGVDIQWAEPWAIECKNCETWGVPAWWRQAVANSGDKKPLLVMAKNRHEPLVVMRLDDWVDLL